MKSSGILTVARDTISLGLGAWILVHEEQTGSVHWELISAAVFMLVGPSALAFIQLLRPQSVAGAGSTATPSTPTPSSSSLPPSL